MPDIQNEDIARLMRDLYKHSVITEGAYQKLHQYITSLEKAAKRQEETNDKRSSN